MSKEFKIDSNNVIDCPRIMPRGKKWNSTTLKWESTNELIAYRHAEIKGKRVYCCIPSNLLNHAPFEPSIYEKNFWVSDEGTMDEFTIAFMLGHNLQAELEKPKGGLNHDENTYIKDPDFDTKKYGDNYYSFQINVQEKGYDGSLLLYNGIYEPEASWQNRENRYYIIGSEIDYGTKRHLVYINFKHDELFHENISQSNFGTFIIQPDIKLNKNKFFNSGKGLLPKMSLTFDKQSRSGRYNVSDGGFGCQGIGLGSITVYKSDGSVLREVEIRNKPFSVRLGTNFATGKVGSLEIFCGDNYTGELYLSDYPGMYVQFQNFIYYNQESSVYLESYNQ